MNPMTLLREAMKAVPALKYAMGVCGLVAVVAIVSALRLEPRVALIGALVTLVLMVALVIFAKLTKAAPKHFLLPVLVMMWSFLILLIASVTLLFSYVFFRVPPAVGDWIGPATHPTAKPAQLTSDEDARRVREAVRIQAGGDLTAAWSMLPVVQAGTPEHPILREERIDLAMARLREGRPPDTTKTFSDLVDEVAPCLRAAVVDATGVRKADIIAHLGWSAFLKRRDGQRGVDVESHYRTAMDLDKGNPYANTMLGHWFLWEKPVKLSEALPLFDAALASGRERAYVRSEQLAAFQNADTTQARVEMVRVLTQMRTAGEPLPDEHQERDQGAGRLLSAIYAHQDVEVIDAASVTIPATAHLETMRWLRGKADSSACEFGEALLMEKAGQVARALVVYQRLNVEATHGARAEIPEAIARCAASNAALAVFDELRAMLAKGDGAARVEAVTGLSALWPAHDGAARPVVEALRDSDAAVRARAAAVIRVMRPTPEGAVPALGSLLGDGDEGVRRAARTTLKRLGEQSLPAVVAALEGNNQTAWSEACDIAASLGEAAAPAVPGLTRILQTQSDAGVRQQAAYALGEIGEAAIPAVPALVEALRSTTGDVSDLNLVAIEALGKFGPAAEPALPMLVKLVASEDVRAAVPACETIGNMGAEGKDGIAALTGVLNTDAGEAAAAALARIATALAERRDVSAIPSLTMALEALRRAKGSSEHIEQVRASLEGLR